VNADGSNPTNLTHALAADRHGEFSPSGGQIVFYSDRNGNHEIYRMAADGSNPTNLTQNPGDDIDLCWAPGDVPMP